MSAALDARGLKRVCAECGIRFYDLNKRPVVCPSCNTEFTGETKVKTRRSRSSSIDSPANKGSEGQLSTALDELDGNNEDEDEEEDDGVEIVSLDDDEAMGGDGEDDDTDDLNDPDLDVLDDDDDLEDLEDLDAGIDPDLDDEDDLDDVKNVTGGDE